MADMTEVLNNVVKLLENWDLNEPPQRLAREIIFLEQHAKKCRDLAYDLAKMDKS
jgi:hypothetical protein